jgi:hypothetical protein
VVAFRVPIPELSLDSPIAWTNVVLDDIANDQADVFNLCQLSGRPVMQELRAFRDRIPQMATIAIVVSRVKSAMIKPKAKNRTAETEALLVAERAPILKVELPLLDRVDRLPLLGDSANLHDLSEERCCEWCCAENMGRLACIMRHDLYNVVNGTELHFRNVHHDLELVRSIEDVAKPATR